MIDVCIKNIVTKEKKFNKSHYFFLFFSEKIKFRLRTTAFLAYGSGGETARNG